MVWVAVQVKVAPGASVAAGHTIVVSPRPSVTVTPVRVTPPVLVTT